MKFLITILAILIFSTKPKLFAEEETLTFYYEVAKETCHDIFSIRTEMDRINKWKIPSNFNKNTSTRCPFKK